MYYVEELDLLNIDKGFMPIESSWEFTNPTLRLKYACIVARLLAVKEEGDKQFRVVSADSGKVWANYVVVNHLISTIETRIKMVPLSIYDVQPSLSEIKYENEETLSCPKCDVELLAYPVLADEDNVSYECHGCGTIFYLAEDGEKIILDT